MNSEDGSPLFDSLITAGFTLVVSYIIAAITEITMIGINDEIRNVTLAVGSCVTVAGLSIVGYQLYRHAKHLLLAVTVGVIAGVGIFVLTN